METICAKCGSKGPFQVVRMAQDAKPAEILRQSLGNHVHAAGRAAEAVGRENDGQNP